VSVSCFVGPFNTQLQEEDELLRQITDALAYFNVTGVKLHPPPRSQEADPEDAHGDEVEEAADDDVFVPPARRGERVPPPKYPTLSPSELSRVEKLVNQLDLESKVCWRSCREEEVVGVFGR
jgi:hypothetical protein